MFAGIAIDSGNWMNWPFSSLPSVAAIAGPDDLRDLFADRAFVGLDRLGELCITSLTLQPGTFWVAISVNPGGISMSTL